MKISGFTIGKNISKLYYPIKESILSILPIVDEFIVVLGDSDPDDTTRKEIESIGSDKIKIYSSVWDTDKYTNGTILAQQTDLAKSYCTGDWLFYIQADEVIHEKDLPKIKKRCEQLADDKEVEGLLFKYIHFWGDYNHYQSSHGWYKNEIRIIRNLPDIHSWRDAQSFRKIPDFDNLNYRQKEGAFKLKVAKSDASVFHYGWVRPPSCVRIRIREFRTLYIGKEAFEKRAKENPKYASFDYGPMDKLPVFKGTHPKVMQDWIAKMNWQTELQLTGKPNENRMPHKHEGFRYRFVSFLEKYIFLGRPIWEFKNYFIVKRKF
jgi:hypothetical protein